MSAEPNESRQDKIEQFQFDFTNPQGQEFGVLTLEQELALSALPPKAEKIDLGEGELSDLGKGGEALVKQDLYRERNRRELSTEEFAKSQSLSVEDIKSFSIRDALAGWLKSLSPVTENSYRYFCIDLLKRGIIPRQKEGGETYRVEDFNSANHEAAVDYIKSVEEWSESTRQSKAACYISFTGYLNRMTQGWFRKAIPQTGKNKTFFSVRDKCSTEALSLSSWHRFIDALTEINQRDALIAKCMLQGAKRISEVLSAKIDQIDWEKNIIRYKQSKNGGTFKEIPITYPKRFMDDLKAYIEGSSKARGSGELIFVTKTGKGVTRFRINQAFEKATVKSGLAIKSEDGKWQGTKVTPHVLRATWVTLAKQQKVQDSEIMKVTGHSSLKMVNSYDKTSLEDNETKRMELV